MKNIFRHIKKRSLKSFITTIGLGTIIIILLPTIFSNHSIKIIDHQIISKTNQTLLNDLNNDNFPEKINIRNINNNYSYVNFYNKEDDLSYIWNIKGNIYNENYFVIDDYNNNNYKELFVFSTSHDSLFINYFEYRNADTPITKSKFVTLLLKYHNILDFDINVADKLYDITGDDFKELIFSVCGDFSEYPRNLFTYNLKNDTITSTKKNNILIDNIKIFNTPNNIIITGNTHATNYHNRKNKLEYSSNIGWLMAFDKDLNFKFEPIPYNSKDAYIQTEFIKNESNELIISLASYIYNLAEQKLTLYDLNGIPIWERINHKKYKWIKILSLSQQNRNDFLLIRDDDIIEKISSELLTIKEYNIPNTKSTSFYTKNITNNNEENIIQWNNSSHILTIYDQNFSNAVSIKLPELKHNDISISKITQNNGKYLLSIKDIEHWYTLEYGHNPLYPVKYIMYIAIYLFFFLIFYLLNKIYIIKNLKKEQIIAQLRVSSLKNQIDPHFTLNALNAVGSSILNDNREEAYKNLHKFSSLIRSSLLKAEYFSRSLEEELEFVKNYLDVMQLRYKGKFDYIFEVADDVDTEIQIPKLIIQSFIENAIKHGINPKESLGLIQINITEEKNGIYIKITDNGIGRENAKRHKNIPSTGKGISIINQYLNTFNNYNNNKILYSILDLYENRKPSGTMVKIYIPYDYEYKIK